MDAAASASASAAATAPLLECHLCDLSFDTVMEKRQHAKSEWHVYKIRCRVAEPGTTIPIPDCAPNPPTKRLVQSQKSRPKSPSVDEESISEDSESDTSSERDIVEFAPSECLFCNQTSKDFDENLAHMHDTHSLVVPFQSSLAVDLQTLVWFLHMIIFTYRECICCGKRRRTVEAVQQHMTSMGHCRFNITEEMSEFYNMDSLGQDTAGISSYPDDRTLRLPSGKLLAHRSHANPTPNRRLQEKSPTDSSALPASEEQSNTGESSTGPQALTKSDRNQQALANQLAQLRTGDQASLVHLPEFQQRSLLVARRKELDKAKRAERRERARVDRKGNRTSLQSNNYKQEVPVYTGG